jgi:hypothetical protein
MEQVSGEHLKPEQWSDGFYENFGRTVGGLHRAGAPTRSRMALWCSVVLPTVMTSTISISGSTISAKS